ncbi:M23 family metallopeptidase [Clostridium sp. UBA4548]|uniref:M23 family metallopeptidase n=1 Tax=Clostridium sp. UBA4548 TaxID=1946361 RepID=UPI0025B854F1|nr:M23 family metallopeptidase [Clostridium sp. UBA4548]
MVNIKSISKEIFIVIVTIIFITLMIMSNSNKIYTGAADNKVTSNEVDGLIMKSDGVEVGVVNNEEVGNKAIEIVKERYLAKAKISEIKTVIINNKITYEKITCDENQLNTAETLSNKIVEYNNNNKKNIVSFTIVKESKAVPVISSVRNKMVTLNSALHTPTIGWLTSSFGVRDGVMHKGIDLAANLGTPVEAALDGKVSFSGTLKGYGKVVKVDHGNGMETIYAHCNKLYVNSGEEVKRGDHIADVGSTGDSTGPHLHFEVKINGNPVDPLKYGSNKQY